MKYYQNIRSIMEKTEEIEDYEIDEIAIRVLDSHKKIFKRLSEI